MAKECKRWRAKNHMVIMPDADLDMAASALMGRLMALLVSVVWHFCCRACHRCCGDAQLKACPAN